MWVAEFRVWHEGSPLLEETKRLDVSVHVIYLNPHLKRGKLGLNRCFVVNGPDAGKYIALLKNDKRLHIKRIEGNQVFYEVNPKASYHSVVISPDLFLVRPIVLEKGWEHWTIASWSKKKLIDFFSRTKKSKIKTVIELESMRQEHIQIFTPPSLRELTTRQREAFLLAMRSGYYKFPRKANLHDLARLFGTNVSSFRENLRKAEQKLLTHFLP